MQGVGEMWQKLIDPLAAITSLTKPDTLPVREDNLSLASVSFYDKTQILGFFLRSAKRKQFSHWSHGRETLISFLLDSLIPFFFTWKCNLRNRRKTLLKMRYCNDQGHMFYRCIYMLSPSDIMRERERERFWCASFVLSWVLVEKGPLFYLQRNPGCRSELQHSSGSRRLPSRRGVL